MPQALEYNIGLLFRLRVFDGIPADHLAAVFNHSHVVHKERNDAVLDAAVEVGDIENDQTILSAVGPE